MARVIDLTGRTFERWSVEGFSHQVGKMYYWNCVCTCGERRPVFGGDLKRGGSLSCGCLAREKMAAQSTKHGMAGHPAYRSWIYLRGRCNDANNDAWHLYGGRGISVAKRWDDFDSFWEDMGATWAPGLSIDRIETNGNYEPGNCRWATAQEQASNRRTNHVIQTPDGPMTVTDAATRNGLTPATIFARIRYGWAEKDLLAPAKKTSRVYAKHT